MQAENDKTNFGINRSDFYKSKILKTLDEFFNFAEPSDYLQAQMEFLSSYLKEEGRIIDAPPVVIRFTSLICKTYVLLNFTRSIKI